MYVAGTECSNVANTGERSSHAVYAADFTRTKLLQFETQSVCAYAARTQAHFNFLTLSEYYHFMPMHGVQKRGAWRR